MYPQFGLTLTVTHACNLHCSYCYARGNATGRMSEHIGRRAIERAVASLAPEGTLELGFFGGEPLLEADLISTLMDYAQRRTRATRRQTKCHLTTNGTLTHPGAWSLMMRVDLELAISCDGLPEVHDRHRHTGNGHGSAERVLATIRQVLAAGKDLRVVIVVRPDTVDSLPDGMRFLRSLGVRHLEPSLDLWTQWADNDITRLQQVIAQCARVWRDGLPRASIGWFDEKAAELAHLPRTPTARCGFGHGEVAVAPSGRLYPCERLIGEDADSNPMALPGHVLDGDDFLDHEQAPARSEDNCRQCAMLAMCNTFCRCGNYVRSGDIRKPDWLLCAWNQACLTETANALKDLTPAAGLVAGQTRGDRRCRTMP